MAVSIALFGMTAGALFVFAKPRLFEGEMIKRRMAVSAWLFALTIVGTFLIHINTPFYENGVTLNSVMLLLTNILVTIPFFLSGIGMCLALTKFEKGAVSRLYAADLGGGAAGCILLFITLLYLSGQVAVFVTGLMGALSALCFALDARARRAAVISGATAAVFFLFIIFAGAYEIRTHVPLLRFTWVKGVQEEQLLYEKWNSFSRVSVTGDPNVSTAPFGWGFGTGYRPAGDVPQLGLTIDGNAYTVLTGYRGNPADAGYLRYDVTNAVHSIRTNAHVLVIGAGGGRDVLSALAFGQASVRAVEMNPSIVDVVNREFGDFTGHLDRDPRVTFVNDEARSYITRSTDKFDVIEASLIDTWAATTAGAYVLSENSLYTVDAWDVFLNHLTPGGVLSVSRWYSPDAPGELYRTVSLAAGALKGISAPAPAENIVVMRNVPASPNAFEVATVLVSNAPFSKTDLQTLGKLAARMGFEILESPVAHKGPILADLAAGRNTPAIAALPLNLAPPTDDSPFFFQMSKFGDIVTGHAPNTVNVIAVSTLFYLLIAVFALFLLSAAIPSVNIFYFSRPRRGVLPLALFFSAIGFGYMLIEIVQMQRLAIYLGNPAYSLSVVLATLLLSSGLGSYATNRASDAAVGKQAVRSALLIVLVLVLLGIATPRVIAATSAASNLFRILVAMGILAPAGFFMGMAFPFGMRLAYRNLKDIAPWFWGLNGAASVCGSVLAIVIAIAAGISAAYWTGTVCYLGALGLLAAISRGPQRS